VNLGLRRLRRSAAGPAGALFRAASKPIGGGGGLRHAALGPLAGAIGGGSEDLDGTLVMVTGASSGIGEATARRLAAANATVLMVARSADRLERIAAEIGAADGSGEAHSHPCDLTDLDAIDALCEHVLAAHGAVDVLVNNAGRSIRRSIAAEGDRFHDFERMMQLNYFGAVRLILRLLPAMREQRHGQVINVSSAGVQIRTPRFSAYIASKAALEAFSDAVQAEALDDGIRFTTISMPLVRTPMISPTRQYERMPTLTPDEAAALVVEAVAGRPRRVAPPFAHVVATIDRLSPEAMDVVRNRVYKMFPE